MGIFKGLLLGSFWDFNRLKIRKKESTCLDFEIIKKGFEGFYKVYPSLEPKESQALARLFIKEVKILNDKVDIEFLEFPELAHQDPVQILKEPSIRGAILMAVSNSFKVSFRLVRTRKKAGKIKLSLSPILNG